MHVNAASTETSGQVAGQRVMDIPEVSPLRFPVEDVAGFKAHLDEHGCESLPAPPHHGKAGASATLGESRWLKLYVL